MSTSASKIQPRKKNVAGKSRQASPAPSRSPSPASLSHSTLQKDTNAADGTTGGFLRTRCSITRFLKTIEEIWPTMTPSNRAAIMSCTFGNFLEIPKIEICHAIIELFISQLVLAESPLLLLGNNNEIEVPFNVESIAILLGIPMEGEIVCMEGTKKKTEFFKRVFSGNPRCVRRDRIEAELKARAEVDGEGQDVVRLYMLYVCNCILFPTARRTTPAFLLHCLEEVDEVSSIAWAEAVHRFLLEQLHTYQFATSTGGEGKVFIDGCILCFQLFLFEILPKSFAPDRYGKIPRYRKWGSKRVRRENLELIFSTAKNKDVYHILPRSGEEQFLRSGHAIQFFYEKYLHSHTGNAPQHATVSYDIVPQHETVAAADENITAQAEEVAAQIIHDVVADVSLPGAVKRMPCTRKPTKRMCHSLEYITSTEASNPARSRRRSSPSLPSSSFRAK